MYTTSTSPSELHTSTVAFDKDNHLSMRFVTASSNLRAHIFSIETSSFYTAKGIAGNIIPAIATTNAIVAGLQVLELFKILKYGKEKIKNVCKFTYCLRDKTRKGEKLRGGERHELGIEFVFREPYEHSKLTPSPPSPPLQASSSSPRLSNPPTTSATSAATPASSSASTPPPPPSPS